MVHIYPLCASHLHLSIPQSFTGAGNEEFDLEELAELFLTSVPCSLGPVVSSNLIWNVIFLIPIHEVFEGINVADEVALNLLAGFLHQVMVVSADSFCSVLQVGHLEEVPFDIGRDFDVNVETFQVVPPGEGRLPEGTFELPQLLLVGVPSGNLGSSFQTFDEAASLVALHRTGTGQWTS